MSQAAPDSNERIRRGRPRTGEELQGPSPTVKGSLTPHEYELFLQVIAETEKNQSGLVRDGVRLLLQQYGKLPAGGAGS